MLFAADIGNTNIDLGVFDGNGTLLMKSKIASVVSRTADEYAAIIKGVLSVGGFSPDCLRGSILSSVVPSLTAAVKGAVKKLTGLSSLEVGPGLRTGLNIRIDVQTQLGADIAANAVAASSLLPCPLIVVDVGTATTFTVLSGESVLEGVVIAPGLWISLDALASAAAELPDVSLDLPKHPIGKNTRDSIASGALYGHAFMIDGFVNRIRRQAGMEQAGVILTGGLAETVLPLCSFEARHEPDLVLKGLWLIYRKNRK